MARRALATFLLSALSGCAIPSRDNPHDPSVAPEPVIAVTVDGVATSSGSRGSAWVLDGSGSTHANGTPLGDDACLRWSLSTARTDEPPTSSATEPEDWRALAGGECATSVDLTPELADVADFSNGDGTGATLRWVRLRIRGASAYALIQIVNETPVVRLGPDRRTAPGGRWWTSPAESFALEIEAIVDDPDEDLLTFDWFVTGALATTLDTNPADGRVDAAFVMGGGRKVGFDQPIDPSRSELIVQVHDGAFPAYGSDRVRADVLTTLWLFNEGTGHLRRIDTSQFLNNGTAASDRALAIDGPRILAVRYSSGTNDTHLYLTDRGFRRDANIAEIILPESDIRSIAASPDGAGGWWVVAGSVGRVYHVSSSFAVTLDRSRLDGQSTPPNASEFQTFTLVRAAPAPGTDVWVTAAPEPTFDTRIVRLNTSGTALQNVAPVEDTDFGFFRPPEAMVSDGAGGVWMGAQHFLTHVTAAGVRTQMDLPDECGGVDADVKQMAYDVDRDVMWVGSVVPNLGGNTIGGILCRVEGNTYTGQLVDTIGPIIVDPVDGTSVMSANDGTGLSRYDAFSVASVDYVPLTDPEYKVQDLFTLDGQSFVATVQTKALQSRMLMIEAGEVFEPNNVVLGVDPYEFDNVRHVVDPSTGIAWVFHPDELVVRGYAPDGRMLVTTSGAPVEAHVGGTGPHRGFMAFDAGARRVWLTSYPYLLSGFPPDGRLWRIDLPASPFEPLVATSAAGVVVSSARGISVVPSDSPSSVAGRVCLSGTFDNDDPTIALGRAFDPSTGTLSSKAGALARTVGVDAGMRAVANPVSGDCFFAPTTFDDVGFLKADGSLVNNIAYSLRYGIAYGPGSAGGPRLYAINQDDPSWIVAGPPDFTSAFAEVPETQTYVSGFLRTHANSLAVDPYYGHLWVGLADDDGEYTGVMRFLLLDDPGQADPFAVVPSELQTDPQGDHAHIANGL